MYKGIFLLALLFASTVVMAGPRVTGNGGDVVVCRNARGAITSVELLDFFEERTIRSNPIDLLPAGTAEQNFTALVERLDAYNAQELKTQYAEFFKETLFLSNVDLVDIPDSSHTVLPKDCKIEQIAIQAEPTPAVPKRYTINKDLWDRLDSAGKAGLVLHEVFYRKLAGSRYSSELNSIPVRYLNGSLASQQYSKLKFSEQLGALMNSGFSKVQLKKFVVEIGSIDFDQTDKILSYTILAAKGSTVSISPHFSLEVSKNTDTAFAVVELGKDVDDIRKLNINYAVLPAQKLLSNTYFDLSISDEKDFGTPDSFTLDDNGALISIEGPSKLDLKLAPLTKKCHRVLLSTELNCGFPNGQHIDQAWVVRDKGFLSFLTYTYRSAGAPQVISHQVDYRPNGSLDRITYLKHINHYGTRATGRFRIGSFRCTGSWQIHGNLDGSFPSKNLNFPNECFDLQLSEGESVYFKDDRYIKGGFLHGYYALTDLRDFTGAAILWDEKNLLEFYEDGQLKEATLVLRKDSHGDTIPLVIEDVQGRKVPMSSYTHVEFDQSGRVIRVTKP